MKTANPNYDANAAAGENRLEKIFVQPQDLRHQIYIDPHLDGQTFVADAEVSIDGIRLETGSSSHPGYASCNKRFCPRGQRRQLYGNDYVWISNTGERKATAAVEFVAPKLPAAVEYPATGGDLTAMTESVPQYRHPHLIACQDVITYDSAGESAPSVFRLGFNGKFPMSTQCNALRQITKQRNTNSWLHPGVRLDITLQMRTPLDVMIERNDVTDDQYWAIPVAPVAIGAGAAQPAVVQPVPAGTKIEVNVLKMTLTYQSAILSTKEEINRLMRNTLRYHVDVPVMRLAQLHHGIMAETVRLPLPAGTKIAFLLFYHESQLVPNARPNSYMSSRFRFAPFLDEMVLSLTGREGISQAKGITFPGNPTQGRSSHSLRAMHRDLVNRDLYHKSFDSFFPPFRAGRYVGYDSIWPVDLTPYSDATRDLFTLEIALRYSQAALSQWNIVCFAVGQWVYEWNEKTKWTWRPLV